jgi:putative endonuclease
LLIVGDQRIVYILKNADSPARFYTGVTSDVAARLAAHNAGRCSHTGKYRPWTVDVIVKVAEEERALKLERYLKTESGVEFARRHLR